MTLNEEREKMREHFAGIESLIKEVEETCKRVHEIFPDGNKCCNLGTDCPFHAAFEENTVFGCRLAGLKSVMQKRKRTRVRDP